MSNNKHFADLLKVCSILPALAILPAMAEVKTEAGSPEYPVDYVTNHKTDEMGRDGTPMGLIRVLNMTEGTFIHDLDTNVMVINPSYNGKITAQNLFVGIQSNTDDDIVPTIKVVGDENTVLSLSSDKNGVYPLLSRFAELSIGSEDNPLGEVNLVHSGAAEDENTAIYVTGGNNNKHADSQVLNIYANNVSIQSNYEALSGSEGKVNLIANDRLDIVGHIYGYNKDADSGLAGLIYNINQNDGNNAKTTIVGNINAAKGSEINIGLKGEDSSITGDVLVSAEGLTLPGGGINLAFGDGGKITGNITAKDKGKINIFAGDDFEINGNVLATTEGSSIDIQGSDIEIESDETAVKASQYSAIDIGTTGYGEIEIAGIAGRGARADNGAVLNIGNVNTESVSISSDKDIAVMALAKGATVNLKGKNINLSTNADGWGAVHAGNNVLEEKTATVNIIGDNIKITAPEYGVEQGIGVAAMSWGVVNIEGNTAIRAQNAILARGESQVNINKSGKNTVKMLGDIAFDYDKATSGSKVDAFVDVTLAGKDSFWTGNTVVSYLGKAPDESYFKVSSAKIALKDGAVWNATMVTDDIAEDKGFMYAALNDLSINNGTVNIADTTRGIFVDRIVANDATFSGGLLNVNESFDIESGDTVFNGNVFGSNGATLTLASGATMDIGTSTVKFDTMEINGTVIASVTNGRPYGHLYGDITAGEDALLKLNVGSVGTYKIFSQETSMDIDAGVAYNVTYAGLGGEVIIETKSVEKLAADAGISTQVAGAIAALTQSYDPALQKVSLAAQQALNSGNAELVERESKKLNPETKPVAQSIASSVQNQVLSLAAGRMSGAIATGRAGGDTSQENGFWMHGLFNKSKMDGQFHGYTRGVAFGMDTVIDGKYTLGGGLAFNNSDVHSSGRGHTDIDSKTLFMYGQYKPNNWFANIALTYSMAEYDEETTPFGVVKINNVYDVDTYGAQIMTGYDFASGVTTEAGVRYLHIAQDAYANTSATDTDFLTGVAGLKYAFSIENDWAINLKPELRAALTYDLISEADAAVIDMPGVASYRVQGESLKRFGGEFGIGLTADYKGLKVSLMYDLDLHKDYTSQTGMIKLRTQF